MGGPVKRVGDEIPLLSWSLHLLGEAEEASASGEVALGPRGSRAVPRAASPRFWC